MTRCAVLSVAGIVLLSAVIALPVIAGGDSPQDVYALYIVAQRDGNLKGMCEYVTEAKVKQLEAMPEEQKTQIAEMMKMMAPTEYTVVNEDIQGDSATLTLVGKATDFSGSPCDKKGTACFVKEGGLWKLAKESWK